MAETFYRNKANDAHVVVVFKSKDQYDDPATADTSTKVSIYDATPTLKIDNVAMTEVSEGVHEYEYPMSTSASSNGTYTCNVEVVNDGLGTLFTDTFVIAALPTGA